nr:hypothetical protein [Tanacetum cinerariifolium]
LFEQAPHSPEYVPRDHVPVFVPEFEHPEDLPPGFLSPRIRPLVLEPLVAAPRPGCEVRESSTAAARRPEPTMAHGVDCSYVETRLRDTERRMMASLELVNLRARVAVLETHVHRLEWQHQAADDLVFQHIMHTHALEARARDDTLE